jgi:hypothetical protein
VRYIYKFFYDASIEAYKLSIQLRFYSVAVITSGSDQHYIRNVGHPGDPGSIPGKTYPFALSNRLEIVFGFVEGGNAIINLFLRGRVSRWINITKRTSY